MATRFPSPMKPEEKIRLNITAHDRIAGKYEKIHDEIFNDVEQARIANVVLQVVRVVKNNKNPKALDIGCGSGNLTRHLINLGIYTVSADISENFLRLIEKNFPSTGLSKTLKINGQNLANIPSRTFDIVAAYSVLHHVPDYLHMVSEMCRVLRPGGVIYLDHEANKTFYNRTSEYAGFLKRAIRKTYLLQKLLRLLFGFNFYICFIKKRIDIKYSSEGDIHVWPDDHIQWDKIKQLLNAANFEIVLEKDYLIYKGRYRKDIYEQYKDICNDTKMLIARKRDSG